MLGSKYTSIVSYLNTGRFPNDLPSTPSNFKREASAYSLSPNGQLLRGGKRVVRFSEREAVFASMHSSHSGRDLTWKKIKERFYWRGGQAYVAQKVSECVACAYKNNTLESGLVQAESHSSHTKSFLESPCRFFVTTL